MFSSNKSRIYGIVNRFDFQFHAYVEFTLTTSFLGIQAYFNSPIGIYRVAYKSYCFFFLLGFSRLAFLRLPSNINLSNNAIIAIVRSPMLRPKQGVI